MEGNIYDVNCSSQYLGELVEELNEAGYSVQEVGGNSKAPPEKILITGIDSVKLSKTLEKLIKNYPGRGEPIEEAADPKFVCGPPIIDLFLKS